MSVLIRFADVARGAAIPMLLAIALAVSLPAPAPAANASRDSGRRAVFKRSPQAPAAAANAPSGQAPGRSVRKR